MTLRAGALAVILGLAVSVGTVSGPAVAAPSDAELADSACFMLFVAGAPGAVTGEDSSHKSARTQFETACTYSSCWARVQDPDGTSKCSYGRGATLTINAMPSARAARRVVKKKYLAHGFHRVKVRADIAGIEHLKGGYLIVMAVGRSAALLSIGPASDTDSSPTWSGLKREAISEAKTFGRRLRKHGCPADYHRC